MKMDGSYSDDGYARLPGQSLEAERPATGSQLAAISNAMVRIFKEQFGRGPTKARSYFAGPDTLLCVLEDSLTPAERLLAEMGEHQRLRDMRLLLQHSSEKAFREAVEAVVGRPVRSFMSAMDTRTDTAVEVFVFEPES
jgi:uncharacterized protein YbcI